MLMNYTLRFVLLILCIVCFILAQECTGYPSLSLSISLSVSLSLSSLFLSLLEMLLNLLQYRGSVGIFNNRNFFVQSKVTHFTHLSDNNNNNNNNLAIGLLLLLNKLALVLLI